VTFVTVWRESPSAGQAGVVRRRALLDAEPRPQGSRRVGSRVVETLSFRADGAVQAEPLEQWALHGASEWLSAGLLEDGAYQDPTEDRVAMPRPGSNGAGHRRRARPLRRGSRTVGWACCRRRCCRPDCGGPRPTEAMRRHEARRVRVVARATGTNQSVAGWRTPESKGSRRSRRAPRRRARAARSRS
jgi:hypothetical protein